MKKKYLPLIALVAGFISALITAGVHSMFFVLLPIWAFLFDYFSSWRWGLLNGFLLFLGYTLATSLMWWGISPNLLYAMPYLLAFLSGGFSICIISVLAPLVRRGIRRPASVAALIILAAVTVWCGYLAWPNYGYYYQVIVHTSEDTQNLELYLPTGGVSGKLYEELYDHPYWVPGGLTKNYTKELVDTEHGKMLKLTIPELMKEGPRDYPYTANIIFSQENPPLKLIHLMPRYNVVTLNTASNQEFIGPVKVRESLTVEEFKVPVMVKAATTVQIEFRLENRTDRGEMINFAYGKSNTYTELITYEGTTSDKWILMSVEVTDRLRIRGASD